MRVLITTDTVGGVWTFTQELASGLCEQHCDVTLVSLGRQPSPAQQVWCAEMKHSWGDRFSSASLDTPLEWMQCNEHAFTGAAPFLAHLAEQSDAEVIHANQFCFGALPVSSPKLVTAHSDVFSWAAGCRAQSLEDSPWIRQYRSLVSNGLRQADLVVAPTQWMLQALNGNFAIGAEQCVIPNGRSLTADFNPDRKLQAVTAGRLWDEAKAVSLLANVSSPIPLLTAGEAIDPPAGEHVHYLGTLAEDAVLALFRESSIYVCTSLYEPFGLAPLEAALCGCAVLARDIPSLHEVWQTGALYFTGADDLSQLLRRLHADPAALASLQRRSFQQAQKYSRQAMTSAYLSAYTRLLARPRSLSHVA